MTKEFGNPPKDPSKFKQYVRKLEESIKHFENVARSFERSSDSDTASYHREHAREIEKYLKFLTKK
jgi:DNA-binding ferritin-like protein